VAKYDHGGGCPCGLNKYCDCGKYERGAQMNGSPMTQAEIYEHDAWQASLKRPPVRVMSTSPATQAGAAIDVESVKVLNECVELQRKKSKDYQSAASSVRQADYYPSGCRTIWDIMHGKMLRLKSLMEADAEPNFEGIEDSAKDLINYASFFVSYARGRMEGQDPDRDHMNRRRKK